MKNLYLFLWLLIPLSVKSQSLQTADSLFQLQQWKAAATAYEKYVKPGNGSALSVNRLAFCYQNLGDLSKALDTFDEALRLQPAKPLEQVIHSRKARIFSLQHQPDMAFTALTLALDAGYSNLTELEQHADFAGLHQDARFGAVVKRAQLNAMPCMAISKAREFDFWIGEWDAYVTGTSTLAGYSKIERASGGCMILENWTSKGAGFFEGKSINFVDPATGFWKQVWVGSGGLNVTEFLHGAYRDGAMRFEFEAPDAQGKPQQVHFFFFNQGADQVRQLHETSSDGGKTWTTTYDFTYKRRSTP